MDEEIEKLYEDLMFLFEQRKYSALRAKLLDMEPADIGIFMEDNLDEKEQLIFFRLLPKDIASDVFVEIDTDTQEALIKAFNDKELKAVINDMFLDDTVDILEEMPANVVKRVLKNTSAEDRKLINELLEYPEDSAGSIMTPEFVSFLPTITVEEAFNKIRKTGVNKETIYTCYVHDKSKKLIGVLTVKDMLLANKDELIEKIMDTNVITVETIDDKEEVAQKFSKYDFLALPVVDKEGCIVGIVTVDDAVDVLQEEATEDIQKMAAIVPSEKPYLQQSVWHTWKTRIPWLILLMISTTFTSLILSSYEEKLMAISSGLLYVFVPMLMGTAGNAGGQSSVTVIRAIAMGEVQFKDIFRIIWKELRVAFFVALSVSVICLLKLQFLDGLYNDGITWEISAIISLSVFISIIMAKIIGCILPIIAKIIHLDPAVVASPFMTTIVDALTLIIYCSICISLLI